MPKQAHPVAKVPSNLLAPVSFCNNQGTMIKCVWLKTVNLIELFSFSSSWVALLPS